jgi:hypothetical protein
MTLGRVPSRHDKFEGMIVDLSGEPLLTVQYKIHAS